MKIFKVYTEEHRLYVNKVKAKNYEEAIEKVEQNENSFEDIENNNWETYRIEKLDKKGESVKEWEFS
jgi:predicted phage tail protein